jgi:hypothetical protein
MNLEDLGRRAVACKHWRWMRGMITNLGERVCNVDNEDDPKHVFVLTPGHFIRSLSASERTPRLDDPATLGCLLALVREAAREPGFSVRMVAGYWYADGNGLAVQACETEAEALVAALEAAP